MLLKSFSKYFELCIVLIHLFFPLKSFTLHGMNESSATVIFFLLWLMVQLVTPLLLIGWGKKLLTIFVAKELESNGFHIFLYSLDFVQNPIQMKQTKFWSSSGYGGC